MCERAFRGDTGIQGFDPDLSNEKMRSIMFTISREIWPKMSYKNAARDRKYGLAGAIRASRYCP